MAIRYYSGAASTTYTDAGNWVGGAAPSSGDTVIILADAVNDITGSDQSATLLVSFIIQDGCSINIGSSGAYLQIACDKFANKGQCPQAWIALRDGNGAANVTQVDVHDGYATSSPTTEGLHLKSITTDTMSPCRVHGGLVSFDATSRIPALVVNGGTAYVNDATGISTAVAIAGTVYYAASAAITTLTIGSTATWHHQEDAGDVGTVNCNGYIYWKDGDITTKLNAYEGTVDFTEMVRRVAVQACDHYNATIDERNSLGSPTWTTNIVKVGLGDRHIDPGNTVATTPSL